ncbi:MAG: DMT family transporter [bacterium]
MGNETIERINLPVLLAVTVTILCWSSNFPVIRFVVRAYDPESLSVLRVWAGSIFLGLVALGVRMPIPHWRDWPLLSLFGLVGIALATYTLNRGLNSVGASAGSFLIGTTPAMSALLAWAFFRERLHRWAIAGIAVSFCGVALIATGEGGGLRFNAGAWLVLASAANQACYYVFQKILHRRYSPLQITCTSVWSAALWLSVFMPGAWQVAVAAPWSASLGVLYLGIFPQAVAFVAWNFALSRAGAAQVTSSMFALPVLATLIAWAWLGEVPPWLSLIGGTVALSGVAMVHLGGRGGLKRSG